MRNAKKGAGTRWRKCVVLLIAPMLAILAMGMLTLTGVTPLNLSITGQDFKLASRDGSRVVAEEGTSAYADLVEMKDGSIRPALRAALVDAKMSDGVCLSLVLTFPLAGSFTFALQTTGQTRLTDLTAHVGIVAAKDADLNPETTDGKPAALDMSNVSRGIRANLDASEMAFAGGHPGTLGLESPGAMRVGSLQIGGVGAKIKGTLKISGLKFPHLSTGRGVANGECF